MEEPQQAAGVAPEQPAPVAVVPAPIATAPEAERVAEHADVGEAPLTERRAGDDAAAAAPAPVAVSVAPQQGSTLDTQPPMPPQQSPQPQQQPQPQQPEPAAPTAIYQQPVQPPHVHAATIPPPPAVSVVTSGGTMAGVAEAPPYRQVKFENALDFLDEVKLVYANQPEVYNQFLDTMKEFKTKLIDTPGVILRVKELFKSRPNLVLGFNNFLPPGYKISLPELEGVNPADLRAQQEQAALLHQQQQQQQQQLQQQQQQLQQQQQQQLLSHQAAAAQQQAGAAPEQQQPEFYHARNFVKKIKMRFAQQPSIYKAFLEILHLYHKGSHNIREVYTQVAKLFRDHTDLLEEFTQFLPDTTGTAGNPVQQAQAPGPSQGYAESGEQRRRKPVAAPREKRSAPPPAPKPRGSAGRARAGGEAGMAGVGGAEDAPPRDKGVARALAAQQDAAADDSASEPPDLKKLRKEPRAEDNPDATKEERRFYEEVSAALSNTQLYQDFIKAVVLFNKKLVTRSSILEYGRDLLHAHPDLFERFRRYCNSQAGIRAPRAVSVPHYTEMDFTSLQRHGVSYRALPKLYRRGVCTGRTAADQSVLNDTWVSVPTGREDEQVTFRGALKNQYEEVLFQCEDDRYELDLVVELNASTIRHLEPIRARLADMTDAELRSFRLAEPLDVLHQRSIERLYGSEGAAVLEGLYDNPAVAIPIVLARMKQKDREWRQNRREWDRIWREVSEKNQVRALDHESLGFKNTDKKNYTSKPLMADLKQRQQERLKDLAQGKAVAGASPGNGEGLPHLSYAYCDAEVVADAEALVRAAAVHALTLPATFDGNAPVPLADPARVDHFFEHFLRRFLGYQPRSAPPAAAATAAAAAAPASSTAAAAPPAAAATVQDEGGEGKAGSGSARKRRKANDAPSTPVAAAPATPAAAAAVAAASGPVPEVKPVVTAPAAAARVVPLQTFYGNKRFYVFLRVFSLLCARLRRAKELQLNSGHAVWKPFNIIPEEPAPDAEGGSNGKPVNGDKYAFLLAHVGRLSTGEIDNNKFEDDLREQFGLHAYVLFTMDRLLTFLVRRLTAIVCGDECVKLLGLWEYELRRTGGQGLTEPSYRCNAQEIVGPRGRLVRLCFVDDAAAAAAAAAAPQQPFSSAPPKPPVTMAKALTVELLPGPGVQPRLVEITKDYGEWSRYVQRFLASDGEGAAAVAALDARKVFLARTCKASFADAHSALAGVVNVNGLRAKISLRTYRMFYAQGSEDFFYRPRAKAPPSGNNERRSRKFHAWLSNLGLP